jgi:hypothetical protein
MARKLDFGADFAVRHLRQPTIVVPARLLGHLRRRRRNGQRFMIEFNGRPVSSIDKACSYAAQVIGL